MKQSLQFIVLVFLITFQCTHPTQVTGGGDDVTTGRLYYQNGSFAAHCPVMAVPSDVVPGSGQFLSGYETTTDSLGRYFLDSVPLGTYNVYGKKDSLASYLEAVELGKLRNGKGILYDTLKPVGGITGIVRLSASPDSRIVLIMMIGGTMIRWPDDSIGHFSLTGLAEGTYRIRFLATDSRYLVLDTALSVVSGKIIDVGVILLTGPVASEAIAVKDSAIKGVWGPNKTYTIMRDVEIPEGERLEIQEGTRIVFMGEYNFRTYGNCFAKGTLDKPIIFTYGFNYAGQGWHWVGADEGAASPNVDSLVFSHCIFEYGSQIFFSTEGPLSHIYFEMKNCILQHMLNGISIHAQSLDTNPWYNEARIVIEHTIFNDVNYSFIGYTIPAFSIFIKDSAYDYLPCNSPAATVNNNIFCNVNWGSEWFPHYDFTIYGNNCFIYSNCYFDLKDDTTQLGDSVRIKCIFSDPKFVDINAGDYHLMPDSPCRGSGTDGEDMGLEFNQ